MKEMLISLNKCRSVLIFFFLGALDSSTSSDTCSGTACFWAGFLDRAGLKSVLVHVLGLGWSSSFESAKLVHPHHHPQHLKQQIHCQHAQHHNPLTPQLIRPHSPLI